MPIFNWSLRVRAEIVSVIFPYITITVLIFVMLLSCLVMADMHIVVCVKSVVWEKV